MLVESNDRLFNFLKALVIQRYMNSLIDIEISGCCLINNYNPNVEALDLNINQIVYNILE